MRKNPGKNLPSKEAVEPEESAASEIISRLPEGTPIEVIETITKFAYFSGPVPSPDALEKYENIVSGSADRLITMAEKEQDERFRDNRKILSNDAARVYGSIVVSLALVAAALTCGFIGQPLLGVALGTSGAILGIMKAFARKENK